MSTPGDQLDPPPGFVAEDSGINQPSVAANDPVPGDFEVILFTHTVTRVQGCCRIEDYFLAPMLVWGDRKMKSEVPDVPLSDGAAMRKL